MNGQQSSGAPATDETLAALFRHAFRLMGRAHHRHDHSRHAQDLVLSLVARGGSMTQRELLELLDVRSASLSEVLAKLERQGLVTRERDPADRRGYVVFVTQQGRVQAEEQHESRREGASPLFACLDQTERETLVGLLRKLIANLEESAPDGSDDTNRFGRGRHSRRHCSAGERPHGRPREHGWLGRFFHGRDDSEEFHGPDRQRPGSTGKDAGTRREKEEKTEGEDS